MALFTAIFGDKIDFGEGFLAGAVLFAVFGGFLYVIKRCSAARYLL